MKSDALDNEWINKQLSDNHSQGFTILTEGASALVKDINTQTILLTPTNLD